LVAVAVAVATGAWGLVAMSGGASTPVYDRDLTRACLIDAGFLVRWTNGTPASGPPGLSVGDVPQDPDVDLVFLRNAEEARATTAPSEATVHENVIIYGRHRNSAAIRNCLREG
jgi:hypothetical protein